jgi:hypothetical protein
LKTLMQFVALCVLPAVACAATVVGSGVPRTEIRAVSGFHGVSLAIPADVEIRQGASEGVTITGDDNVVALIETKVANGTLEIRWADRRTEVRRSKLEIVVDARTLDALAVAGSGRMHAASLSARSLSATIGGSGEIGIDRLDTDALKATIGGSGQLAASGRADRLDAALAGSGRLSAGQLQARDAQVALQGSPDAAVRVRDTLAVTVAGSGSLTYYGKPKLSQTTMGSGSVRSAGD